MKAYSLRVASTLFERLYENPLPALGTLFLIGMSVIFGHMLYLSHRISRDIAQEYASLYLRSLDQLRTLHAARAVQLPDPAGQLAVPTEMAPRGLPPVSASWESLFASRTRYISQGITGRLYSRYPFSQRPHDMAQDAYEREALLALEQHPWQTYTRFEVIQGQRTLRAAEALRMDKGCVECHNAHAESPKRNWQVGEVAGIQTVLIPQDVHRPMTLQGGIVETVVVMCIITVAGLTILALVITKLRHSLRTLAATNAAFKRFVPQEFLACLHKASIIDVQLADHVQRDMTILFSDIRSFTPLSEKMTPEENFHFINDYLRQMGPIVRQHHGFIDKYIGDAVMALFDHADDALAASIAMLRQLEVYNRARIQAHHPPIQIGIGLNTGTLMLGTIGEEDRMEGTVISDAVNLAAHMEGMTKIYNTSLLISENTFHNLKTPEYYLMHIIDKVKVKGKSEPVTVFGVFDGEPAAVQQKKRDIRREFERGVVLYQMKLFEEAKRVFETCVQRFPEDDAAALYVKRCDHYLHVGWDEAWDGAMQLERR